MASKTITVRVPDDVYKQLPPASLTGKRSAFVIEAIREKLASVASELKKGGGK